MRICDFDHDPSRLRAARASRILVVAPRFAGGDEILMSCWVMVDAPETTRRFERKSRVARPVARRSTPPCWKNRLSSAASVQAMRSGGRSSAVTGVERDESGRVRWAIGVPWRSTVMGEPAGFSRSPGGMETQKGATNHTAKASRQAAMEYRARRRFSGRRSFKRDQDATIPVGLKCELVGLRAW